MFNTDYEDINSIAVAYVMDVPETAYLFSFSMCTPVCVYGSRELSLPLSHALRFLNKKEHAYTHCDASGRDYSCLVPASVAVTHLSPSRTI